jgi:hypothetical protein
LHELINIYLDEINKEKRKEKKERRSRSAAARLSLARSHERLGRGASLARGVPGALAFLAARVGLWPLGLGWCTNAGQPRTTAMID